MRSTERQGGASLIEAVIASALMGIGVVGGLTAWDTASASANRAVRIAWANCIVRGEMDAILASQYTASYAVPPQFDADSTLVVQVVPQRSGTEQLITVSAYDPTNLAQPLAQVSALKAQALAGSKTTFDYQVPLDVILGCPQR